MKVWPIQIAENRYLRLLQRFILSSVAASNWSLWIWVHYKMSTQKHCTISVAFKGFFFVTRIKIFMFAVQLKACLNQLNKAHDWSYHHAINLYMLDCSQCFPKSKLKQNGLSATMIYNLNPGQPQQNISKLCHVIKLIGHGRAKTWKDTQLHRN